MRQKGTTSASSTFYQHLKTIGTRSDVPVKGLLIRGSAKLWRQWISHRHAAQIHLALVDIWDFTLYFTAMAIYSD